MTTHHFGYLTHQSITANRALADRLPNGKRFGIPSISKRLSHRAAKALIAKIELTPQAIDPTRTLLVQINGIPTPIKLGAHVDIIS
jgi:hypothetical protein